MPSQLSIMRKNEFNALKELFQLTTKRNISDATFYRHLRCLREADLDPTTENVLLLAKIKTITASLDKGIEVFNHFVIKVSSEWTLSRNDLNNLLTANFGTIQRETFRRWLYKAGITPQEYKAIPVQKIFLVFLQGQLHNQRKIANHNKKVTQHSTSPVNN